MSVEAYLPVGKSALAKELARLPQNKRETLLITDAVVSIVDFVVGMAALLTDDDDPRPVVERLEALAVSFGLPSAENADKVVVQLERLETVLGTDLPRWAKKLENESARLFLRRLLGAASYDLLAKALRHDGGVLVVAMRRVARFLMPYAVALDSCAAPLSAGQRASLKPMTGAVGAVLDMLLVVDDAMEKVIDYAVLREMPTLHGAEAEALGMDLTVLTEQLKHVLSNQTSELLVDLSDGLGRKIQGARDAIEHSADPVSQAANSLIELIDRLLRQAFDEDTVLAWVEQNYHDQKDLTYVPAGSDKLRPTKKGQALCFAYAGRPVGEPSAFHELAALGLATARNQLQQLKHADAGDAEELALLTQYFAAVEGFVTFALKVGWAFSDKKDVEALRARIAPRNPGAGSA